MYKICLSLIFTMLVITGVSGMNASLAATVEDRTSQSAIKVELTELQKNELANLHKGILEKKEQLISKYVEYGVITETKGKRIITRFEERYKKLEQNGFLPKCDKQKEYRKHEE
ncbi:MAG: YckD family protein [Paenibacillaceae bacterium]